MAANNVYRIGRQACNIRCRQQHLQKLNNNMITHTTTQLNPCPSQDTLENPAFLRFHPRYNILYACTEDITQDNEVRV